MENDNLIFGLAEHHYAEIVQIFRKYQTIEQVLIFGSRAKGTEKNYSDIDLAVIAPTMSNEEFSHLWNDLDHLDLIFKLDVLHWDTLDQKNLKELIKKHGQFFYPRKLAPQIQPCKKSSE
jgi:proline iminopeptidase